jgi:hypothetical protein
MAVAVAMPVMMGLLVTGTGVSTVVAAAISMSMA